MPNQRDIDRPEQRIAAIQQAANQAGHNRIFEEVQVKIDICDLVLFAINICNLSDAAPFAAHVRDIRHYLEGAVAGSGLQDKRPVINTLWEARAIEEKLNDVVLDRGDPADRAYLKPI